MAAEIEARRCWEFGTERADGFEGCVISRVSAVGGEGTVVDGPSSECIWCSWGEDMGMICGSRSIQQGEEKCVRELCIS